MNCNKCDTGQMVQKEGKNGLFMACDKYPNCKHTESVPKDVLPTETIDRVKSKEFHLSVEEVRARALEAAINSLSIMEMKETAVVIELATSYEAYIMAGK